jgi:hypothetical protein
LASGLRNGVLIDRVEVVVDVDEVVVVVFDDMEFVSAVVDVMEFVLARSYPRIHCEILLSYAAGAPTAALFVMVFVNRHPS